MGRFRSAIKARFHRGDEISDLERPGSSPAESFAAEYHGLQEYSSDESLKVFDDYLTAGPEKSDVFRRAWRQTTRPDSTTTTRSAGTDYFARAAADVASSLGFTAITLTRSSRNDSDTGGTGSSTSISGGLSAQSRSSGARHDDSSSSPRSFIPGLVQAGDRRYYYQLSYTHPSTNPSAGTGSAGTGGRMTAHLFPLDDPSKPPGHFDTVTWQETIGPDGSTLAIPDAEVPTAGFCGRESAYYAPQAQPGYKAKLAIQQQSTALAAARGDSAALGSYMSTFASEKQKYLTQSTRFEVMALTPDGTEASTYGGTFTVEPTDDGKLRYICSYDTAGPGVWRESFTFETSAGGPSNDAELSVDSRTRGETARQIFDALRGKTTSLNGSALDARIITRGSSTIASCNDKYDRLYDIELNTDLADAKRRYEFDKGGYVSEFVRVYKHKEAELNQRRSGFSRATKAIRSVISGKGELHLGRSCSRALHGQSRK